MSPDELEVVRTIAQVSTALIIGMAGAVKGTSLWRNRNGNSPQSKQMKYLERIANAVERHDEHSADRTRQMQEALSTVASVQRDCHTLLVKLEDRKQ